MRRVVGKDGADMAGVSRNSRKDQAVRETIERSPTYPAEIVPIWKNRCTPLHYRDAFLQISGMEMQTSSY